MQKRIRNSIMFVTIISVVLLSIFLSLIFYSLLAKQVTLGLWDKAQLMEQILNEEKNDLEILATLSHLPSDVRYTLIDFNGTVLFDSQSDADILLDHSDRIEFQQALKTGKGESKRFSDTIGLESYYVAFRLNNEAVIRLSQSSQSILGIFSGVFPVLLGVIFMVGIFCGIISKKTTEKIIEPINHVDLMSKNIVLYDELSIFIRTISQYKKQIEMQISDIEGKSNLINAVIGSIKEGIILLNSQGLIITANKSALELFQMDDAVLGKNILELTRHKEILENTNQALLGKSCEMCYTKDKKSYEIFFSPGRIGGQLENKAERLASEGGVIILLLDITEKIGAEKMRREFSANVTHELKTPLTNISGYAEMMSSGMAKIEDFVAFSGKIKEEASRLILLIDDILLLSRLDEGNVSFEMQNIDLQSITKQVMEALSEKAKENNVSLALYGENVIAEVNPSMIYELIFNLVDNGIKYNKPNGSVSIYLSVENKTSFITIEDTGVGISAMHQNRVFERFYRVDKSRSKKTGGTGLGLSIVKHIAQVHGGTVTINSREGIGTTVVVSI